MEHAMARPLAARKLDCLYLAFFLIHVPIMLVADLSPLYPDALRPSFITRLNRHYVTTFNDQFFVAPPTWFTWYLYMELFYHLPLSVWAVRAIPRDDPKVPLNLLIWSIQAGLTTLTCIAEISSWTTIMDAQKTQLYQLYVPYLILATVMGVDMYWRLQRRFDVPGSSKKAL